MKKILELKCWPLWIRKDGSKITDPWEIVDDHKLHNCAKGRKEKVVWKFLIYGSKFNLKLSKTCKIHIDYRKEDESCKWGEFKEEVKIKTILKNSSLFKSKYNFKNKIWN